MGNMIQDVFSMESGPLATSEEAWKLAAHPAGLEAPPPEHVGMWLTAQHVGFGVSRCADLGAARMAGKSHTPRGFSGGTPQSAQLATKSSAGAAGSDRNTVLAPSIRYLGIVITIKNRH